MFPAVVVVAFALHSADVSAKPIPPDLKLDPAASAQAKKLIKQLGDTSYKQREIAFAELKKLGRHALPALKLASVEEANTEIRLRCQDWLPEVMAADFEARLQAFLLDTENKYNHELPGWNEFRTASKSHPLAREAFVSLLREPEQRLLFSAIGMPKGEFNQRLVNRKVELYNQIYRTVLNPGAPMLTRRTEPTIQDIMGLLFAEVLVGDTAIQGVGVRAATPYTLMVRANAISLVSTDKLGPVLKELAESWMETRNSSSGFSQASSIAKMLKISPLPYAFKMLEVKAGTPQTLGAALGTIAEFGTKEDAAKILKFIDREEQAYPAINGMAAIQLRDVSLAMAAQLLGHKPTSFGMVSRYSNNDSMRFYYYSFSFPSDADRDAGIEAFRKAEPGLLPKKP
jgi:hypothetical protein